MELKTKGSHHLIVAGMVKNFSDTQALKEKIESMASGGKSRLTLEFTDAYALASSIVGFLNKKIHADGVEIELHVHQPELYEMMQMLSLVELLHVKRMYT